MHKKFLIQLLVGATAVVTLATAAPAAATIVVDFAFDGNSQYPGHVTGELDFAGAGVGVAATGAYALTSGNVEIPVDPTENLLNSPATSNAFTVTSGGVVTAANLDVTDNLTRLILNAAGSQNDLQYGQAQAIDNASGFGGVTYTPATGAVPEPTAWAMMLIGLGGLGAVQRTQRRRQLNAVGWPDPTKC